MAEYVYLGAVLSVALYLLWSRRVRTDVTAVLVMLSLIVPWPHPGAGWHAVLSYEQGFSGFGSSALIMIAAMFVIGGAIVQTGAAEACGLRLLGKVADREWLLQLTILVLSTVASMFINDTTVVLILLPVIIRLCHDRHLMPSRYLMFAAYGALLGGQWTLIGTRSNIILSDFLRQHTGHGIDFFAFAALGAPIFVLSAALLMLIGRHFLPSAKPAFSSADVKAFLTEFTVPEGSKRIGQRLPQTTGGLTAVALLRRGELLPAHSPLAAGDLLFVHGTVETIRALLKSADFEPHERVVDSDALKSADLVTVEAAIPARSYYIGQRLGQIPFERNYGVTVLGLAHGGRRGTSPMAETRLEPGDSLLLLGASPDVERLRHHSGLLLLDARSFATIGTTKAWIVLLLLAGVVATSASGLVAPTLAIPLAGAGAVLFGCISLRAAYEAIDWPTLVTLGGIIPFGIALEQTGAAEALAKLTVEHTAGFPQIVVLGALLAVAVLLTQVIENAAVAIIVAPLALHVASSLRFDPMPIMAAIGVCTSAGFATPVAHESTIIVMAPGRYRFRHYLAVGSMLVAATWLVATLLAPFVWNLSG